MKIAIVTETFLPSTDGIVTRLKKAIDYFLEQGHEVLVVAPDMGVTEYKGAKVIGIKPITFPFYRYRKWGPPSRKVYKILKEYNPDVVHAVNPLLMGVSAVNACKKYDLPLVSSYHTHIPKYLDHYSIYKPARPLLWWYIRRNHRDAHVNVCTSHTMKEELEAQGIKRLEVVTRGVDVDKRHPKFRDEVMRRRLTNNHPDKKLLVYIGRLAVEKDIHHIKPLLDKRDDVALAIIGDGPARRELERIFKGTNTVFTGFLHGEELSQAFASGDAFIFPSTSETLGLVILESMAAGLPLIAAESGPTVEQIEDGVTGIIYESGNLDSLIEAVNVIDDKEQMDVLRENARREALKHSWDAASAKLLDFYKQAVDIHASS